jgi:hypothetical protein
MDGRKRSYSNTAHKSSAELPAESRLRELCAWYEWADPPNLPVAGVLQDAADAVRVKALSTEAAQALIVAWQPFAGLDALVGKPPELVTVANTETELQRAIVADMGRMVAAEPHSTKRVYLARLTDEQIEKFQRGSQ